MDISTRPCRIINRECTDTRVMTVPPARGYNSIITTRHFGCEHHPSPTCEHDGHETYEVIEGLFDDE